MLHAIFYTHTHKYNAYAHTHKYNTHAHSHKYNAHAHIHKYNTHAHTHKKGGLESLKCHKFVQQPIYGNILIPRNGKIQTICVI